jgi:hypothetical protein
MQPEEVYESWAPPGGAWSLWARPVLFAQMLPGKEGPPSAAPWSELDVGWVPVAGGETALVVDLAGEESVRTGLALAARGYRPVPLYNACTGPLEVIDQGPILEGLRAGAAYLRALHLSPSAPPAFLLDARRLSPSQPVKPGVFDNRWQVFRQDFPSAETLKARGVTRAMLVQRGRWLARPDLADVLRGWQEAGIALMAKDVNGAAPPEPFRVAPLAWYRAAWNQVREALGLRRSPPGGFGHIVPEPSHG